MCEAASSNCAAEVLAATRDVASLASLAVPGGEHIVKVWLQDEAGNADPANVATLTFDPSRMTSRTVNTNPPVLTAGPAPSPRLRITRARRSGSTLTVSGTIARAASARIEAQVSRSRTGKPVLAKARVKPKRGKWTARVKLPRSLRNGRAMYLAVKYAGQSEYRATTLRRRLTEKARAGPDVRRTSSAWRHAGKRGDRRGGAALGFSVAEVECCTPGGAARPAISGW